MNLLKEFRWDAADPSVLVPTRSENGVSKVKNSRENVASIVCDDDNIRRPHPFIYIRV